MGGSEAMDTPTDIKMESPSPAGEEEFKEEGALYENTIPSPSLGGLIPLPAGSLGRLARRRGRGRGRGMGDPSA